MKLYSKPAARESQYQPSERYRAIWRMVAAIPHGRVATYGQIAELAGLPRRARLVGHALQHTPPGMSLPWHRVINAQGRSSFPRNSLPWQYQRQRLLEEGIPLVNGCVDLSAWRWQPDLDELLWKPAEPCSAND